MCAHKSPIVRDEKRVLESALSSCRLDLQNVLYQHLY